MHMIRMKEDYDKKYGNIPSDKEGRIEYVKSLGKFDKYENKINDLIHNNENISWDTVSYTFYILPKSTPRPRVNRQSGVWYVRGSGENKKFFKEFIKDTKTVLITTPCIFDCKSYLPIPKAMKYVEKVAAEQGYVRPITIPDWDNLAKTYCDMIKDTILFDDRLIISGTSSKYYSVKPRVEITIKYMQTYDSDYNKKLMSGKVDVI